MELHPGMRLYKESEIRRQQVFAELSETISQRYNEAMQAFKSRSDMLANHPDWKYVRALEEKMRQTHIAAEQTARAMGDLSHLVPPQAVRRKVGFEPWSGERRP